MYRILLVEDQLLTREALLRLFRSRFPDLDVKAAGDEGTAKAILQQLEEDRVPLEAAVLDLRVPGTQGGVPEVSELCRSIRRNQRHTVVAHITAYFNDDDVRGHLEKYHLKDFHNPGFAVDKNEKDWEDNLLRKLINCRVERKLNEWLNPASGFRRRAGRLRAGRGSATYRIASLVDDISRYWKDLEPSLRERIEGDLDVRVDEETGKVDVGLGGRRCATPA